jgi:MerC mercury resistance protein
MLKKFINWDAMGILSSLACAVHCAILPLVVASLPVLGINIIHNRAFELAMIIVALSIGSISLLHGYRKHHNRLMPLGFFCLGFVLLIAKQYWHEHEMKLLPFAVIFICVAHLTNLRLNRLTKSQFT